jgi:hypothetical protein
MIASDSEEIENDGGPALRTAVVVFAKRCFTIRHAAHCFSRIDRC